MDTLVALLASFRAWRAGLCLFGGTVGGLLVAALVSPPAGLIVALVVIGFGLLWEANAGKGGKAFALAPSPPIARPIAFLGMALIGVFWGGFLAEFLGSIWVAVAIVVATGGACSFWVARLNNASLHAGTITFMTAAFLAGLLSVYVFAKVTHNAF